MAQGIYKKSPIKLLTGGMMAQAAGGLMGIAGGIIGSGKRKKEQRAAQAEMNRNKARFENLDTSNLAANLDNAYANTMNSMGGAAGGSGIAAMAQALAGAGNQQAQQAAVSIGQQEQSNQMKAAGGRMSIQNAEMAGAQASRQAEQNKTETLLGMSQQRLGAANAARDAATQSIMGGVGSIVGAGGDMIDNR